MPAPAEYLTIKPVPELSSFTYSGVLVGKDGKTPIPNGALQTLTLSLNDVNTGVVINNRAQQNVLNANDVTVDVTNNTGAIQWISDPNDSPLISKNPNYDDGQYELHIAILFWTWTDGVRTLQNQRKVFIVVEKFAGTDSPNEAGSGPDTVTLLLSNPDGTPLVGASVFVTTDATGQVRASGTILTDTYGHATFKLTNGSTYYFWMRKTGVQPINGQQFVAVKD